MTTDISVGVRWDPLNGQPDSAGNGQIEDFDFEYDGGNSSSRLFERSRIRALAGENKSHFIYCNLVKVLILHTFWRIMLGVGVRESMLHINVKIRLLHITL